MINKNNSKIIAVVPARGGSKGIPRKNIKLLKGKPLITYTIEAAKKSKLIDRIIVSTDDVEIANIAKECGAEIPFLRPEELAKDDITDLPVLQHVLKWLIVNEDCNPDLMIYLRPTAPIRDPEDIDRAVKLLMDSSADSLRSVSLVKEHPYWMFKLDENNVLEAFNKDNSIREYPRRQLLPDLYIINGNIDIVRSRNITDNKLYGKKVIGFNIDHEKAIDIDSLLDFKLAEFILGKND